MAKKRRMPDATKVKTWADLSPRWKKTVRDVLTDEAKDFAVFAKKDPGTDGGHWEKNYAAALRLTVAHLKAPT